MPKANAEKAADCKSLVDPFVCRTRLKKVPNWPLPDGPWPLVLGAIITPPDDERVLASNSTTVRKWGSTAPPQVNKNHVKTEQLDSSVT
jgi:hypothetical protein